jgi:hypothetical protein
MHVVLVGAELEENLSLRYLRGALERDGHTTAQVSFDRADDLERAAREIVLSAAAIAGFSMVFTHRAREFARLIARCRELGFKGTTLAGGHFAAFHAEQLLGDLPALDAVAIGEGERILCELARCGGVPASVDGLVWRDASGLERNPPARPEQDLDTLAWPTRERPFDDYLGLPIVNMLGSRGCTHACAFCSISAWHALCGGARHREREASAIVAEMACLWREGVRLFNFHDDNFLGRNRGRNLARALELREELARQGVGKIGFQIKARPDAIDPELFALLRSMGLFRVFLGIEAGTEASLINLGRGQRLQDNVRALEILNGLDLHVAFNLLVLNPESTLDDFAGNVAFLRGHLANPMNFCRTEIYAGTPLERRLRREHRLRGDYWGLEYVIADARAQRAFELVREAFWERNFGADPVHYLSGRVDYLHQLRADFFGTTAELKADAKQFVRTVNENSVGYLDEIVAAIEAGQATDAFARDLAARVLGDDSLLHVRGKAILERISDIRRTTSRASSRAGAGAALAASVALVFSSGSGCGSQVSEMAAPPVCSSSTPPAQRTPAEIENESMTRGAQWTATDGGALLLHVSLSLDWYSRSDNQAAFVAAPTVTGAQVHNLGSLGGDAIAFDLLPDAGVTEIRLALPIECVSAPLTLNLALDVSAKPSAGQAVEVRPLD